MEQLQLALAALQQGQAAEAAGIFQRLLAANPADVRLLYMLGVAEVQQGRAEKAIDCWTQAVRIKPDYGEAHGNLGALLVQQNRVREGLEHLRLAAGLCPLSAPTHNNLGNVLLDLGQTDEGIEHLRQAIRLKADYVEPMVNLAQVLNERGEYGPAKELLDRAIALSPANPEAHFLRALNLLREGNYFEGFAEYEWRKRCGNFVGDPRKFAQPEWDGGEIAGKTILIATEQGSGDAIQFVRYASLIASRGANVVIECPRPLAALLGTATGVSEVVVRGDPLPRFDVHASVLSLPQLYGTTERTIPNEVPYLKADEERLSAKSQGRRVGIAWAGNPKHKNDRNRSIPIELLEPLRAVSGVTFYSLQKNPPPAEKHVGLAMIDHTALLQDFSDTAALMMALDLVISVDTSIAHLAGALARPVWALLPFAADWRWMLEREDSPWYPTMRLLRQKTRGEWRPVIEEVARELSNLVPPCKIG